MLRGSGASWYREYLFRKMIPIPHDQYLDENGESIEWMVRIDELVLRVQADKERAERDAQRSS